MLSEDIFFVPNAKMVAVLESVNKNEWSEPMTGEEMMAELGLTNVEADYHELD